MQATQARHQWSSPSYTPALYLIHSHHCNAGSSNPHHSYSKKRPSRRTTSQLPSVPPHRDNQYKEEHSSFTSVRERAFSKFTRLCGSSLPRTCVRLTLGCHFRAYPLPLYQIPAFSGSKRRMRLSSLFL